MTSSIHDAYLTEGARQILDTWEANRIAGKYQLSRTKAQVLDNDVLQKSVNAQPKNSQDDGKISFNDKLANFGKGLAAPIHTMLSSPANFMLTLGAVAAGAGIIAITGGAAAPVFVAAGVIGGGASIINGIYRQSEAKTDNEAKEAWQEMGTGAFTAGMSVLGSKFAAKEAGMNGAGNFNRYQATLKSFQTLPENLSKTLSVLISKFITGQPQNNSVRAASNTSSTGIIGKIKNFFSDLKSKIFKSSEENTQTSSSSSSPQSNRTGAAGQSSVIRVSEDEIEVLSSDKPKRSSNAKRENTEIIDAEYTEIVPPNKQLPPSAST